MTQKAHQCLASLQERTHDT